MLSDYTAWKVHKTHAIVTKLKKGFTRATECMNQRSDMQRQGVMEMEYRDGDIEDTLLLQITE